MNEATRFDVPVRDGGYVWWYVDAISDDGRNALTIIAFVGSVFSPYYAWARRADRARALDHCAVNVAIYGERSKRWCMTERGNAVVSRAQHNFTVGPSSLAWERGALTIRIDERSAPIPLAIRGTVRIEAPTLHERSFDLDAAGNHRWTPLAPCARAHVSLQAPKLDWRGHAYVDKNDGDEPLEAAFQSWNWSRLTDAAGRSTMLYDVVARDGATSCLHVRYDGIGGIEELDAPPRMPLPTTGWRVARATRAPADSPMRVLRTLEDTPFYSRSLLAGGDAAQPRLAVHESLSLDRFRSLWVQALLPFRMPRRAH